MIIMINYNQSARLLPPLASPPITTPAPSLQEKPAAGFHDSSARVFPTGDPCLPVSSYGVSGVVAAWRGASWERHSVAGGVCHAGEPPAFHTVCLKIGTERWPFALIAMMMIDGDGGKGLLLCVFVCLFVFFIVYFSMVNSLIDISIPFYPVHLI